MVSLNQGEEIIRKTKPHPSSFLGSPIFWVGISILFLGISKVLFRMGLNFLMKILRTKIPKVTLMNLISKQLRD